MTVRKALVIRDPSTGSDEHCGVIVRKRAVHGTDVWLTYSETDRIWWIVWQDDRLRKLGYVESRREACWETFFALTPTMMHDLTTGGTA